MKKHTFAAGCAVLALSLAAAPAFAQTSVSRLAADLDALRAQGFKLAVIDTPPAITMAIQSVVQVAELIVRSALHRHESRGLHFTLDWPDTLDAPADTVLVPRA